MVALEAAVLQLLSCSLLFHLCRVQISAFDLRLRVGSWQQPRRWRSAGRQRPNLVSSSVADVPDNFPSNNQYEALREEAQELRQRAQLLRKEAEAMEMELETRRVSRITKKTSDIQEWMDKLFANHRPRTAPAVARILMEERCSEEQILVLVEALYRRRNAAAVSSNVIVGNEEAPSTATIDEVVDSTTAVTTDDASSNSLPSPVNQTEVDLVSLYMQLLLNASVIIDDMQKEGTTKGVTGNRRWSGRLATTLQSRLKELSISDRLNVRRSMESNILKSMKQYNTTAVNYMRQTLGLSTKGEENVRTTKAVTKRAEKPPKTASERDRLVPPWVPSGLVSEVLACTTAMEPDDIRTIKERVLTQTRFFCTSTSSIPSAAIFRGNLRSSSSSGAVDTTNSKTHRSSDDTAAMYAELQHGMRKEGLAEKLQLFLLHDPETTSIRDTREVNPQLVVLALPIDVTPDIGRRVQSLAAVLLLSVSSAITLMTLLSAAVGYYALNPKIFDAVVYHQDLKALPSFIPFITAWLAIQFCHEVAHRIVAKKRNIKIGLPVLLPSWRLGSFGCITPFRSFPPNRRALLDFALSGPLVATVLSLLMMIIGCYKTIYASEANLLRFPTVTMSLFKSSFLTGSILTFWLPKAMMMPLSQPIPIHPLFLVGFSQLMASALNLLPVFRLDGGRACTAVLGPRLGALVSVWTLLSMLSLALSGSGLAFGWGAMIMLFQRRSDVALRDEVTAVDSTRIGIWILSLAVALLALLPFPGGAGML